MPTRTNPRTLWIGLGVVVALAVVVAVIASRDSDTDTATVTGVEQIRKVAVSGPALAEIGGGADSAEGQPVPVVSGAGFDGTKITIPDEGRAAVIVFVAHWCPHCQREVPVLAEYLEANPMPDGVDLFTVATSTSPDENNYPPSGWLEREGWPGPVLADSGDGGAARAFGLSVFPYFVAVNDSGDMVARTTGEISTAQFAELVQRALGTGS
ncbi:MAG: TlpA disulfide reductase family protein [Acidimicrobiales bacterium]